jgi:hypothetical protein
LEIELKAKVEGLNRHSFALIQNSEDTLAEADKKSIANQELEEVAHRTWPMYTSALDMRYIHTCIVCTC